MKVWIIVSVMFLMENSQVKIAETVNDSSRFFNTEEQCLNSLENKMVDVRLTYDKGLDRYYGLLDLAIKYGIFKQVSTRIELPDGKTQFGKTINNNPETYFTTEILDQLNECCKKEFKYGNNDIVEEEQSEIDAE